MSLINSLSCQLVARFIPTCIAMAEWGLAFAKFICIMNVLGRHAFYKVHLIAEYNRKKNCLSGLSRNGGLKPRFHFKTFS